MTNEEGWDARAISARTGRQIGELVTAALLSQVASDESDESEAEFAADRVADDLGLTDEQRVLVRGFQTLSAKLLQAFADVLERDPMSVWGEIAAGIIKETDPDA